MRIAREAWFALVPALLAARAVSGAERPSLGVAAISGDPAAAAGVQEALERRLAGETTVRVVPAPEFAPRMGPPSRPGSWLADPANREKVRALFAGVQTDYYQEKRPEASLLLDQVAQALDAVEDAPLDLRVHLTLWRAALDFKDGKAELARREAAVALELQPDLSVPPELPPSVGELVGAARAAAPRPVLLHLTGLPPQASVELDGALVGGSSWRVVAGPHKLEVMRAGLLYPPLLRTVSAETTLTLGPPSLDLPTRWRGAFESATGAAVTAADQGVLEEAAATLGLDVLVIVVGRGEELRARIWHKGEPARTALSAVTSRAHLELLAEWIALRLAPEAPPAAPSPTPTPAVAEARPAPAPPHLAVWVGLTEAGRSRNESLPLESFDAFFAGEGVATRLEYGSGRLVATAAASVSDYSRSSLAVSIDPGPGSGSLDGGTSFAGEGDLGLALPTRPFSLRLLAGAGYERYRLGGVSTVNPGLAAGLAPYSRLAPGASVELTRLPLAGWSIDTRATLVPAAFLLDPAGSGVGWGVAGRVGATHDFQGIRLRAELGGEYRSQPFGGGALREALQTFTLFVEL